MPFTPNRIDRAIRRRKQSLREQQLRKDPVGEEGVLSKVEISGAQYMAKEWRGGHRFAEQRKSTVIFDADGERASVSPFWFKLKKLEHTLMHRAVPDLVPEIVAGYDPRFVRTQDGKTTFDPTIPGRPVTMAPFIESSAPEAAPTAAVLEQAYAEASGFYDIDSEGIRRPRPGGNPYTPLLLGIKYDALLEQEFGELGPTFFDSTKPVQSMSVAIAYFEDSHPNSPLLPLLRAGIVPHHPQWNFIPTGRNEGGHMRGVIVEASVGDPERLISAIRDRERGTIPAAEQQNELRKLRAAVNRLALYRFLDQMYDDEVTDYLRTPKADRLAVVQRVVEDVDRTKRIVRFLQTIGDSLHGRSADEMQPVFEYIRRVFFAGGASKPEVLAQVARAVSEWDFSQSATQEDV
jgi:hypothetical protein